MKTENNISKEKLFIKGGLGPIHALEGIELNFLPVTVLIGPQGAGKSLVSQLLYFFRDVKYLLSKHFGETGPDATTRKIVDSIRGGSLASFLTTSNVSIGYELEKVQNGDSSITERSISIHQSSRKITPKQPLAQKIDNWLRLWVEDPSAVEKILSNSIFLPAERSFFSNAVNTDPMIFGNRNLPLSSRLFLKNLIQADDIHQAWADRSLLRPEEADDIDRIISSALKGKAIASQKDRYTRKWQWLPENSEEPLEIQMASSGQMSTWPLVYISQALFGLEKKNRPYFLHIEEPEAHLHPRAQIAVVKLLAYLANHGIHIVVTTHSLAVLYAFNNLTLAYRQLGNKNEENVPEISVRLAPEKMSAYLFADGKVKSIIDDEGQIDESLLGEVLGDLEVEFNRLTTYKVLWG